MPSPGDRRRERLARAYVYVVTGARDEQRDLPAFLEAVLEAGADIVQLREKDAEAGDLIRWSSDFRAAADRYDALFVMNDRPDVAVASGADGVHVGQNDLPPAWARRIVGPDLLIGLSTHSIVEFDDGAPDADYLCVGPIAALRPNRAGLRPDSRSWPTPRPAPEMGGSGDPGSPSAESTFCHSAECSLPGRSGLRWFVQPRVRIRGAAVRALADGVAKALYNPQLTRALNPDHGWATTVKRSLTRWMCRR